ncbi:MAG: hypothetical protein ACYTGW_14870 [Planctomycetota bacterium]
MRKLFGVWLLVAAGCATPPAGPASTNSEPPRAWPGMAMPVPPPPVPLARVGVEYLAPAARTADIAGLEEIGRPPWPGTEAAGPLPPVVSDPLAGLLEPVDEVEVFSLRDDPPIDGPRWLDPSSEASEKPHALMLGMDLSRERIASVEHPVERMGLRFLREVVGDDRRRVDRALGSPILTSQLGYLSPNVPMTYVDRRDQENHLQLIRRYGTRLLRRPARRALKELEIVNTVERALKKFKAVHIPLTGEYQREHRQRHRGRFSMHLSASDLTDPAELYYRHSGWKIGGGLTTARLSYSKHLTDNMLLNLRSSIGYDDQNVKVLGRVAFKVSQTTTLNLSAGNDITVLTSPVTYTGMPPDQERSEGFVFYVEHMF